MIEIRFHGRGGQGAVVASELLAQAAFLEGAFPQSFPFFGVERRGAPVTAYTRIDRAPIAVRTRITAPDVVVVLEPGLFKVVPVTLGLKPDGLLLVNSLRGPEELVTSHPGPRATVDATAIALELKLGSTATPIVNTAVLGALARATGVVSVAALDTAIERFLATRPTDNRRAATLGAGRVRVASGSGVVQAVVGPRAAAATVDLPDAPLATEPSGMIQTASWRTFRPELVPERCTKCNVCWKFCPDDAIGLDAAGYPVIDLGHCKGCGICAEECRPLALRMVPEEV